MLRIHFTLDHPSPLIHPSSFLFPFPPPPSWIFPPFLSPLRLFPSHSFSPPFVDFFSFSPNLKKKKKSSLKAACFLPHFPPPPPPPPPPLLITAIKTNTPPPALTSHPLLLLLQLSTEAAEVAVAVAAVVGGWRGGDRTNWLRSAPLKATLYVRQGRGSHQRMRSQTQRHLAPAYLHPLSLFLPVFAARLESKHAHAQKGGWIPLMNLDFSSSSPSPTLCFFGGRLFMPHPGLIRVVGMLFWAHATGNLARLTGSATWRDEENLVQEEISGEFAPFFLEEDDVLKLDSSWNSRFLYILMSCHTLPLII